MSSTCGALSGERLASELMRLRAMVLEVTHRRFPRVPFADLEDAYGRLTEQALAREFHSSGELSAWMLEAIRNDAIDIARSARVRTSVELDEHAEHEHPRRGAVGFADPQDAAIAAEVRGLLLEFLVELPDSDRLIAYLHLDPHWAPRQIARRLGLPTRDVVRTTDRVGRRFSRFTALVTDPDALCDRRRDDVIAFLATGQASPALRIHLRRCPGCSVELRRAQEQLRAALLPLLPAGAIPAASLGLLARAHHGAATHPTTLRVNDAIARVRKLGPGGAAGGGGAAITAKVLAAGAVLSVGAAVQAVRGFQAPAHRAGHRIVRAVDVSSTSTAPTTTTEPVAIVTTTASTPTLQLLSAPRTATTTTTTTTAAATSSRAVILEAPDASAASGSSGSSHASSGTSDRTGGSSTATVNPYPVAAAAPNAATTPSPTSPTPTSGAAGSSSGPPASSDANLTP